MWCCFRFMAVPLCSCRRSVSFKRFLLRFPKEIAILGVFWAIFCSCGKGTFPLVYNKSGISKGILGIF
uniref:Uncharacterized protein n=1 Tax=Arundo donax TaxID=35708 RepID=A0A0A9B9K0_ARUDO